MQRYKVSASCGAQAWCGGPPIRTRWRSRLLARSNERPPAQGRFGTTAPPGHTAEKPPRRNRDGCSDRYNGDGIPHRVRFANGVSSFIQPAVGRYEECVSTLRENREHLLSILLIMCFDQQAIQFPVFCDDALL